MALAYLAFLALLPAAPGPPPAEKVDDFRTTVIGTNVLLVPMTANRETHMLDLCIAATGPQQVIDQLRALPEGSVQRLYYEEVPYPAFRPAYSIGDTGFDYVAEVRGRRVARWCATRRFFWISGMVMPQAEGGAHLGLAGDVRLLGPVAPAAPASSVVVNGEAITPAEVNQRLALASGQLQMSADGRAGARAAMERRLIDETLQIQAAASRDIAVAPAEVDGLYNRVAANAGRTPAQYGEDLRARGSSDRAARRQLQAALAWLRFQRSQIEDGIYDPEEDARTIIAGFNAPFGPVPESGDADGTIMNLVHLSLAAADDTDAARAGDSLRTLVAGGCGNALTAAQRAGAAIFTDAYVPVRDLPVALRQPMLALRVGQASPPFRSEQGVGILILCGRDEARPVDTGNPNALYEMRIARRAQRWLRDLRRDAVIDYR